LRIGDPVSPTDTRPPRHPRTRELLDYLAEQRGVLRQAFDSVPPPQREQPPAPDRWSATGIIEHLSIVEGRTAGRLLAALTEARENGLGTDPATTPILPLLGLSQVGNRTTRVSAPPAAHPTGLGEAAAWAALEQASAKVRSVLLEGDGLDLSRVSADHPLFGPLTLYAWFAFVGAHEARHAGQIREIAAASTAR
jgi:hypothetical protein